MTTKANPGKFDCHAKAADDEPLFTLRAKDPIAPQLVLIWKAIRAGRYQEAEFQLKMATRRWDLALATEGRTILPPDSAKAIEAVQCATDMAVWHRDNVL